MKQTAALQILHLEDEPGDAEMVNWELKRINLPCEVRVVASRAEYIAALDARKFDAVLADNAAPGMDGLEALKIARQRQPNIPFLVVSSFIGDEQRALLKAAGASDFVVKSELAILAPALQQAVGLPDSLAGRMPALQRYPAALEKLVAVVQELSLARDLNTVTAIVRKAARDLTGADGATFVLRENGQCYYADEDAIAPLWKGKRFPMSACISGWAMLNRQQAVIEDIYADPRIPQDAYRPTFVKSLVMVPIRTIDPIGAIGNYWAQRHAATPEEVKLLQALADTTAVAMENVQVYSELERRVAERTAQLAEANKELEAFSYSVSHDLRAPLRSVDGFSKILLEDYAEKLDAQGKHYLERVRASSLRMGQLIEDLLNLSRLTRSEMQRQAVDLSTLAAIVSSELSLTGPDRHAEFIIQDDVVAQGDPRLLRVVLENLLGNAWKYTSKHASARIEFGVREQDGQRVYFVKDDGAGFDKVYSKNLFGVFRRLHGESDFPGTGIGLATVQRVIHRHGGKIWADGAVEKGAAFYFTLESKAN